MLSLSPCFTRSSTDSYDNVVMKHLLRLFLLRLKGFQPKSLCTAFYCSNIGLQHETLLLYCQLLLWEKLLDWFFFLFWRDLRWKPQIFTSLSHSYLPCSVVIDCICQFEWSSLLLFLQIWLRLRHMMHSPLVQAPPLHLNLARQTHPPPLLATGAHGDHTEAAGLEMNATDQVRTAWLHTKLFFCYIFFICHYSPSQSLTHVKSKVTFCHWWH